jgi:hypothetical protein
LEYDKPLKMNTIRLEDFQREIQAAHGAPAKLVAREKVYEVFQGDTVWEGEVLVFELLDHPNIDLCYAWEMDGEITVVLGEWPVDSAPAAVKAVVAADAR